MQDYLKKKAFYALLLSLIEIISITIIFILKHTNVVKPDMLMDYLIIITGTCIFVNLFFILIVFSLISKAKTRTDVNAIDIVGSDIQEIYKFGMLGIIIVDEKNKIIWTNDWFPNSQSLLIDKELFKLMPDLIQLTYEQEENKKKERVVITINNRQYEASYKKTANMFILKDVSSLESITAYNINHSPVLGIISIDNYADIAAVLDDIALNDMLSSAQKQIVEYAKENDVCLRKFRADSFMAICTHESFEKMIKDRFSIIQKVREQTNNGYELTLSIGFAEGFDDYNKLSEMASASLNLALSRGGDQAVVFPYGKNYVFFGGKSEAKSKRNQSRIRVLSQSLTAIINESENVFIMGHSNADFDAIGSALGLYCFVKAFNKKVYIVYDENLIEAKARRAFKQSFSKDDINLMTITPLEAQKLVKSNSLLILTDVHSPKMCMSKELVESFKKFAVIDHHRRSEEFVDKPLFVHIEPSASSASELVTELIRYNQSRIEIPSKIATMMLAGILLDTNHYRNKIGTITYDASLILKEYGANNNDADNFLKVEYNEYVLKTKIMASSYSPYTGIIVATSDDEDIIDRSMLAIVAQETLEIKGIKACFVIGRIDEKIIGISCRSDGTVNCQMLMEKLNGGGHYAAAATAIPDKTVADVHEMLKDLLEQHLNDAMLNAKGVVD